jgi:hypothetical protein
MMQLSLGIVAMSVGHLWIEWEICSNDNFQALYLSRWTPSQDGSKQRPRGVLDRNQLPSCVKLDSIL